MLNIQLRDINLDTPKPHIELVAKKATDKTWPWGTKNHRVGLIALPEKMEFDGVTVELHLEVRRRMARLAMDPEAYLCVPEDRVDKMREWQRQGLLRWDDIKDPTGNFARHFLLLQQRAGIKKVKRFHELRAAFTTLMFDQNMPAVRVAKAVRHRNLQITMRYDRKSKLSLVTDVAEIAATAYLSEAS
jgi:hypothetical protein